MKQYKGKHLYRLDSTCCPQHREQPYEQLRFIVISK